MNEEQIIALLKSINTKADTTNIKLEALQSQMVMFQEALNPDLEYKVEKLEVTEEVVKPKKLPRSTKKLEAGAVYNFMGKNAPYTCKECKGLISWDLRPERTYPLHVDKDGHVLGTGDCPEWEAES